MVKKVVSAPPSVPLNIISVSLAAASTVMFPDEVVSNIAASPAARSSAASEDAVTSVNDNTPLPFVFITCPLLPSALGKSNATPLDVKIKCPPSEDTDSFASWNCNVGVPPESANSKPVSCT